VTSSRLPHIATARKPRPAIETRPHADEARVEGDDQQEREQHLHARDDDPQLAGHLLEVAIQALQRRLGAPVLALRRIGGGLGV
jgi:hypothetical protein